MNCREFEETMSQYFSQAPRDAVRDAVIAAHQTDDWTSFDRLGLCGPQHVIHLMGCSACVDSLVVYLDIRAKVDYHEYPCFHLAAASAGEYGDCIAADAGEFVIKLRQSEAGIVIAFCPWCGVEIPSKELLHLRNPAPPIEVRSSDDNWVRCPSCRWRFALYDPAQWDGWRHLRCGQRLNVRTE